MSEQLHPLNVIALIWDFDKTLSPHYMQKPLFERYGVDEPAFWRETQALADFYRQAGAGHIARDTLYLNHLLTYVAAGRMPDLTNARLRELGREIAFFPGLPECFRRLKELVLSRPRWRQHDLRLEHYVLSNGLYEMIQGSAIAHEVDGIWGCEFIETPAQPGFVEAKAAPSRGPISQVLYAIDNTTKTRCIFEINKGSNTDPAIGVNDAIAPEQRRVPMTQMIYVADGPSDIPVFSLVRKNEGRCYAVYAPGDRKAFAQAKALLDQGRVHGFGEADYRDGGQTWMWLTSEIERIAESMAERRERLRQDQVARPPAQY